MQLDSKTLKEQVKSHWENETCGVRYAESDGRIQYFREISKARYELEPYIHDFADFNSARNKTLLEIGVGAGTDFTNWTKSAQHSTGVDLTEAAIQLTRERLVLEKIDPSAYSLQTADAENLNFENNSFDIVYSWGVLHHSPNTKKAVEEVFRVLKTDGTAKIMVYHLYSWVTLMLYLVHGLLKGRFLTSPRQIVFEHLESPGTKAYTIAEIEELFTEIGFKNIKTSTKLSPADFLGNKRSSKYTSFKYKLAWAIFPSRLIRLIGHRFGLYLLVEAQK